ncbi:MAG TPA: acetyl-CoA carboxylase biotin carboxyl carrier protein [Caulobacteraceae bacterium]|nr:acetyl-CoA carboxylase biotin carboxyl carrier protein [Caulobacteraceae bacterium]
MPETKAPADPIDARLVRRLAAILNDTGLTEIEVERGDLRIKVARNVGGIAQVYAAPALAASAPAPIAAAPGATSEYDGEVVKSPMVGTVYLQPEPGASPFVRVGDIVTEGQTLLIVEAMKTMNPIPAPRAGRIVEMLVGDGQAVEFGAPLAVIA